MFCMWITNRNQNQMALDNLIQVRKGIDYVNGIWVLKNKINLNVSWPVMI